MQSKSNISSTNGDILMKLRVHHRILVTYILCKFVEIPSVGYIVIAEVMSRTDGQRQYKPLYPRVRWGIKRTFRPELNYRKTRAQFEHFFISSNCRHVCCFNLRLQRLRYASLDCSLKLITSSTCGYNNNHLVTNAIDMMDNFSRKEVYLIVIIPE